VKWSFDRLPYGWRFGALSGYGVTTARRGWLTKKDVINTYHVNEFLEALRPKPGAHGEAGGKGR